MKRLTIMVRADETARADIALTPERTYYRFATDSSIEDGELGAIADFEQAAEKIVAEARALEGEDALPPEIKVQIFVDNRLHSDAVSEQSLRRMVGELCPLHPEFAFLRGFLNS